MYGTSIQAGGIITCGTDSQIADAVSVEVTERCH